MNEPEYRPIVAPSGWIWAEAFRQLGLAGRTVREWLGEVGRSFHLSDADVLALWVVLRCQVAGADQRQLADAIGVSPAQVSGLVERLGRDGLIFGVRPEHDRRRQVWRLTDQGEATIVAVLKELEQQATAAEALNAAELTRLFAHLAQWPTPSAKHAAAAQRPKSSSPESGRARPSLRVHHEEDAA